MKLTKSQRAALCAVFHRQVQGTASCRKYRTFRRTVKPGPGCVLVPYAGMWLGIEPDGCTQLNQARGIGVRRMGTPTVENGMMYWCAPYGYTHS